MERLFMRLIKSWINMIPIIFIINLILYVLGNEKTVGELVTGINVSGDRILYTLMSFVQWILYLTLIGWIITIYWWLMDEASIAERLSGASQ